MFQWLRDRRRERILAVHAGEETAWAASMARLEPLEGLDDEERKRLRETAILFLHDKALEATAGAEIDDELRRLIALQAALPILNLGLDWYRDWYAVVVYPDDFIAEYDTVDEDGVAHRVRRPLSGESWDRGPMILSAAEVLEGCRRDGLNVVLHESVHKLDALEGGRSTGRPPLHRDMEPAAWSRAFTAAYEDLCVRVDAGEETPLDPYASDSPAEFLAVTAEAFFELPHLLRAEYPEVYRQLTLLFRQDPASRLPEIVWDDEARP